MLSDMDTILSQLPLKKLVQGEVELTLKGASSHTPEQHVCG